MGITPNADLSNDTRGWIMCIVSALACVLGASIICVDLLTAHVPRWRSFRIQQSDTFLAASLSLSFGVMIFSSLFSILPSSRKYLESSGLSDTSAGLAMISSFGIGVVGIGAVSRFLHHFMPSHVVECDHEHGETETESETASSAVCHSHTSSDPPAHPHPLSRPPSETTPLLSRDFIAPSRPADGVRAQVMSFIQDTKANCDQTGPCYGYRDPCGNTCFKIRGQGKKKGRRMPQRGYSDRSHSSSLSHSHKSSRRPSRAPRPKPIAVDSPALAHMHSPLLSPSISPSLSPSPCPSPRPSRSHSHGHSHNSNDLEAQQHHHHVPTTPFLSIGLQTSIAIGLHKFPEGFITFATNHANPALGLSVFLALLVHNIAEGFSLALPLYLAVNSRPRAILWSALLGGLSQPLGAGVAALWFRLASSAPSDGMYGLLFATTAGIMVGVGLQLFSEGLALRHDRDICAWFAFVGMALMGVSGCLVSH
ncbi:Zinc transporter [Ceratocystis pirilliformis]|uniref:Zinc transporter n=1 Tax=Ceratocystis pirilliformis TaxID=259994 RepID=A0ABR3YV16_9PEZI